MTKEMTKEKEVQVDADTGHFVRDYKFICSEIGEAEAVPLMEILYTYKAIVESAR